MLGKFWSNWGKRIPVLLAVLSLVGAGIYGHLPKSQEVELYLPEALPEATTFELLVFDAGMNGYLYAGSGSGTVGYVTVTDGPGFGGPMTVVVGWSPDGTILSLFVPKHHEDTAWFDKLYDQEFFDQYIGRQYNTPLMLSEDIDATSGATVSSNGVAIGVHYGRELVAEQLGDPYTAPKQPIDFGMPEILLLVGLGSVVVIRIVPPLKRLSWLRYLTLAFGLGVLGIWLVRPLSLTNFSTWLIGSPPYLATNLFLYILVFGVLGLAIILGKNFYCHWLCPFAAVQEITHAVGRESSIRPTAKWRKTLSKAPYIILWLALFLALVAANPSLSVFEPWGTLFGMAGAPQQWLLLAVTLALSAFIYNLWCYYACPVGAVMDIVLRTRREAKKLWNKTVRQKVRA